jgi:hypothetical protein
VPPAVHDPEPLQFVTVVCVLEVGPSTQVAGAHCVVAG